MIFENLSNIKSNFIQPLNKDNYFNFPELFNLLIYNLSMIARYETEWWRELTKMMQNRDYPFIWSLLNVTMQKDHFWSIII
ncbi:YaaC family protein [Neobacillus drentensis]|uniref:YaaC family protein n=1 Tax=Neobacillus drentensis TaxID=220684 RepID=UPI0030012C81